MPIEENHIYCLKNLKSKHDFLNITIFRTGFFANIRGPYFGNKKPEDIKNPVKLRMLLRNLN